MLDLDTVRYNIERWIEEFVEVPNSALGGWPPCPYARRARLDNDYEIKLGFDPGFDLVEVSKNGINKSVLILVYDAVDYPHKQFSNTLELINNKFLIPNDLIALEDHPGDPEIVNGISMNQGTYVMALVQSLSDLNKKAQLMAKKGFYDKWPEDYLEMLFKHRTDPRKS